MRKLVLLLLGVIAVLGNAYAQNRTITGKVLDEKGTPIPNVTVLAKGSQIGGTTDAEGSFSVSVPSNTTQLLFSIIGFEPKAVNLTGAMSNYTVVLTGASAALEDVVITGYTREKRSNYAGATAKVDAKAINQVPNGSIDQILQGRAPGVWVTAGSGQPGSAANVIIRGATSINGTTTPLYIMDGIPIEPAAFASLSPGDIASVDVLKDATAAALYGSRGSNGVIVITTKRGGRERLTFNVKSQYGISQRTTPKFIMMNSQQRIQFEEEIGEEQGLSYGPGWYLSAKNPATAGFTPAQRQRADFILDSLRNSNVDWTDIFFREGKFQEYDVSASGGSERVSFFSALNYFKQEGTALRSELERYSLRNNLDFRGDRLTASISSSINYSTSSFIESENTSAVVNPFAAAYYALPYESPYINGTLYHSGNTSGPSGSNPFVPGTASRQLIYDQREGSTALERVLATTSLRNELKGVLSTNLRYKILEDLSFITTLGLDFRERMTQRLVDPTSFTGSNSTGGQGSFGETVNRRLQLTGNAGFNYNKRFGSDHLVDVTALYETMKTNFRSFGYTGFGINPLVLNTPAGITAGTNTNGFIPSLSGGRDMEAIQSGMMIAKYTFADRFTFNGSVRYDGTTQMPENNRWNPFWAVGASWNLMKENFMDNIGWVSDLQLRASYGLTASPIPGRWDYLTRYGATSYEGASGLVATELGNLTLDWEYAKTTNIGLDFNILNRKLRGSIELYNKVTDNLFVDQQLSATSGVASIDINAGSMRNRGIEVGLNSDLVSTKDLIISVGGSFAYNDNEITSLGQVNEYESGTSIIRVGLPLGTHYIPRWAGVDAATGDPLYYTTDGKLTNLYNSATQSVAEFGTWLAKINGGFNANVNYKGLFAEAFFTFSQGAKRFNNEDFFNETPTFGTSNQSVKLLDRWRNPGDITNIQRYGSSRSFSSKDIQDASYLRFRNLRVGYNLPATIVSKMKGVSAISVFAQGQNLYTWTEWTGFDPEDSNNISLFEYPAARTFTVGLNISL